MAAASDTKKKSAPNRLGGLRRFAVAITVFNILGHTWLGFEQSWAQPVCALLAGYLIELLFMSIDAWQKGERPKFLEGPMCFVDSLLSAHISSLAVAMLLYSNDRIMPIVFAVAVALCSKHAFRITVGGRSRHFLNPSNFGITVTLLTFHWVGIAPPYHFTENLGPGGDWILPLFIIVSGSFLNTLYTKRVPLLSAWVVAFAGQAVVRNAVFGTPIIPGLVPMSGVAFVLFTFYMVTDPATTPSRPRAQIAFGAGVAGTYGLLMALHVVFGLFFGLTLVCVVRGLSLYWEARRAEAPRPDAEPTLAPVSAAVAGNLGGANVSTYTSAGGTEK